MLFHPDEREPDRVLSLWERSNVRDRIKRIRPLTLQLSPKGKEGKDHRWLSDSNWKRFRDACRRVFLVSIAIALI